MTRRNPATTALVVLLGLEAAAATAAGVIVIAMVTTEDGPVSGPLDPTAVGVLAVGLSMLGAVIVLLCSSAIGLWRRREWAPTIAGIVESLLVVGGAVGLYSGGWQPLLAVLIGVGAVGLLLLLVARATSVRSR